MSVLSQPNKKSIAAVEGVNLSSNWVDGGSEQRGIADPAKMTRCTPPRFRMDKVLAIRRQLAKRTYDLEKRLDAALDRLINTLDDNDRCGTGHNKRR